MKRISKQKSETSPPSDSPKSEIEEVMQSLKDISWQIEKLATGKEKS